MVKKGDCVVLDKNPLENIKCLQDNECIRMIFKDGILTI